MNLQRYELLRQKLHHESEKFEKTYTTRLSFVVKITPISISFGTDTQHIGIIMSSPIPNGDDLGMRHVFITHSDSYAISSNIAQTYELLKPGVKMEHNIYINATLNSMFKFIDANKEKTTKQKATKDLVDLVDDEPSPKKKMENTTLTFRTVDQGVPGTSSIQIDGMTGKVQEIDPINEFTPQNCNKPKITQQRKRKVAKRPDDIKEDEPLRKTKKVSFSKKLFQSIPLEKSMASNVTLPTVHVKNESYV